MTANVHNWKYNNASQLAALSTDELLTVEQDLREAIRAFADAHLKITDEMFWLLGAIINEKKKEKNMNEFDEALDKIGELYEEGKDCLNSLPIAWGLIVPDEKNYHGRLFEILREMRDIAALAYKKLNTTSDN